MATAGDLELPVVGAVEWVTVEPAGLRMEARIDTGAETASVDARDIELFERDGDEPVRARLSNRIEFVAQ